MSDLFNDVKHAPFWWEAAPPQAAPAEAGPPPAKAEVAIVGAGFTGLVAALRLARAGRDVVLFDTVSPGFGCSSRNGGMVGPSFHKLGVAGLTAKYGEQRAINILGEGKRAVAFFREFMEREQFNCDLAWTGRFVGAVDRKSYDALAEQSEGLMKHLGVQVDMLTKGEQHAEVGSDFFHGGAVYHEDGGLHPGKYVTALAAKVAEAGARVHAPCKVTSVRRESDGFTLETEKGEVRADKVLIATNGYTGKELQAFRAKVIPLRSAIITTEELSENMIRDMFPNLRMHGDRRRLVYYYRPTPDGKRLMFGGRGISQSDKPDAHARDLYKHARAIFPQIADKKISHSWSGTVAYTFDHAPHLGQLEGMYYSMGYCGSGVTRASYLGWQIAGQMLGDMEARTAFDDLPFEGYPFYTGNPWFMPALVRWHSALDQLRY